MALAFPITVTGAEVAERALGRVGDAAVATERRVTAAAGGSDRFAGSVRRLDDVVDAVEKPMRALNGALDIASVALGVGLAGPLGVVIGQLGDLATQAYAAIEATAPYEAATRGAADAAATLAAQEAAAAKAIRTRIEAQQAAGQSAVERAVGTIGAGIDARTLDRLLLAGARLEAVTQQRAALVAGLIPGRVTESQAAELDDLTRSLESAQAELRDLGAAGVSVAQATTQATTASRARAAAVREETSSIEGLRRALDAADPALQRAAEARRARDLVGRVESGAAPVTDGLFPSERSTADVLAQGADAFGGEDAAAIVPQATAAQQSIQGVLTAATDLQSFGVGALQQFSMAAGQALSSLIIDGDATSKSLRRVAGEVAASLSATSLGYAVFLSALGGAATLMGPASTILGFSGPQLLGAAAVMGATGVALGLTARALGAGTGGGSARPSAGSASGGGGDRVGSLSSGRPGGSEPIMVTVILGVEQVASALVSGSRRDARAGGLTGGRLAVT